MDVVVTPAKVKPGTWTLSDRLRRPLGEIHRSLPGQYSSFNVDPQFRAVQTWRTAQFPSLDDAMSAIARHMKGEVSAFRQ